MSIFECSQYVSTTVGTVRRKSVSDHPFHNTLIDIERVSSNSRAIEPLRHDNRIGGNGCGVHLHVAIQHNSPQTALHAHLDVLLPLLSHFHFCPHQFEADSILTAKCDLK